MSLAEILRTTRQRNGVGLRELARRIAVDPSHLSRVEVGKVHASRSLLLALAEQLGIDQESLLAQGGYMPADWQQALAKDPASIELIRQKLGSCRETEPAIPQVVREPSDWYSIGANRQHRSALQDPLEQVFPSQYVPTPEINEIYELKLALLEAKLLTGEDLIERGAYFVSINDKPTYHYRICTGGGLILPTDSSVRLQSFISTHQFKTSYATHGLFPYRGKYHPQMVKALLNIMQLKAGCIVLDPMAGSGTTAVEAATMGINSIAVDVSPFCNFMTDTKIRALSADISELNPFLQNVQRLEKIYDNLGNAEIVPKIRNPDYQPKHISRTTLDILVLAYLDAKGYAERSSRKNQFQFFKDILLKYATTIERFQGAFHELPLTLASSKVILGDARELAVESNSVDGVIFSPPYSFAVDYLANDAPHLKYLGYDIETMRPKMIGLSGGQGPRKVEQYFQDMSRVLDEVARVLKPSRYCTIIVGSNSQQLARILRIDPMSAEARHGIERRLVRLADEKGLFLELAIRRLIVGMANSMREEHILIFCNRG